MFGSKFSIVGKTNFSEVGEVLLDKLFDSKIADTVLF